MADFRFLNYNTEYEVHGTINKKMGNEACFSYVFGGPEYMSNTYKILIFRGLSRAKRSKDNNCFLDKNQLHHHISIVKKLFGFTFSIEEKLNKDMESYFEVTLIMSGNKMNHKFILTWIRYSYEFPYNMYIVDVYRLKKEEEFKYVNPINIFNIIAGCYYTGNSGHMLTFPGNMYKVTKTNSLRNSLKKVSNDKWSRLNNVFTRVNVDLNPSNCTEDYAKWEDSFKDRTLEYIKFYKKIKKL